MAEEKPQVPDEHNANPPSRQELRRQRRGQIDERQHGAQQSLQRRQRAGQIRIGVVAGLVAVIFFSGLIWAFQEATRPLPGTAVADEGREHVAIGSSIEYAAEIPASGPHYPATAPWGFTDLSVPRGFYVHNLEHGGTVFLYKCEEGCEQVKQQFRTLLENLPNSKYGHVKAVAAPSEEISNPIVALAWNRIETYDTFQEPELRRFYLAYLDRGPEDTP